MENTKKYQQFLKACEALNINPEDFELKYPETISVEQANILVEALRDAVIKLSK